MKFLIQRVTHANVSVDDTIIGSIQKGFLVFVGICESDTLEIADKLIKKLLGLRIFQDMDGKTNLSLADVQGELLIVSQFTLYADCRKGNRPSFIQAGSPEHARNIYDYILEKCRNEGFPVEQGEFGADMMISLTNEGPFTVILDSEELCK